MTFDLRTCVVRVESLNDYIGGTGFVVTHDLAVTCAHVVEALGVGPGDRVRLRFHVGGTQVVEVLADGWHREEDVAFLRLTKALPEGVVPTVLGSSQQVERHDFTAFGYPEVRGETGAYEGIWAEGKILGQVTDSSGQTRLHIRTQENKSGMSGAPLWDVSTSRVIGMMKETYVPDDTGKLRDTGFGIPTESIVTLSEQELELLPTMSNVPFMALDLPNDFVQRPREFEPLVDLLTKGEGRVAITAALRGAGGYGKTTLATALCHHERVQMAFLDGILWVTLGETPDVMKGATKIYDALTGERLFFVDPEDAAQKLAQALGEKRCLLVIDDVWNKDDLKPFLRGGDYCTRLITTRKRDTLPSGSHTVDVAAMLLDEAVELLATDLSVWEDEIYSRLKRLAVQLGKWPLLLRLVNGALRRRFDLGKPLADALTWVQCSFEEKGLTAFDAQNPKDRAQAVSITVETSLKQLSDEERERYYELAVFPQDVEVPLSTVTTLWSATGRLDYSQTENLCELLFRYSLIQHLDLSGRILRLHDVMRTYLIERHGSKLPALHQQLTDAYADACPSESGAVRWSAVPRDQYIDNYLVYHLIEAGEYAEVHQLFAGEGWSRRRSRAGLISDFVHAKRLVTFEDNLSIYLRYTIFESVAQGMYEKMPVAALPAAMSSRIAQSGLSESLVQAMVGSNADKVRTYLDTFDKVDTQSVISQEIINLATKISDPKERVEILLKLIEIGVSSDLLLSTRRAVWMTVLEMKDEDERSQTLDALLPLSTEELGELREEILGLQTQDLWGEAFDFDQALSLWMHVIEMYDTCTQHETWELLWERTSRDKRLSQHELARLFFHLPRSLKKQYSEEIWEMLSGLPNWESVQYYSGVVKILLPHVLDSHLYDAWERIQIETEKDFEYRGYSLALSLLHLPHNFVVNHLSYIREQIRDIMRSESDYHEKAVCYLLINLALHLDDEKEKYEAYQKGWEWATYYSKWVEWLRSIVERIEEGRYVWQLWKETVENLYKDVPRGWGMHNKCKFQLRALAYGIPIERLPEAVDDCFALMLERTPSHIVASVFESLASRLSGAELESFWQELVARPLRDDSYVFPHAAPIEVVIDLLERVPLQFKCSASRFVIKSIKSMEDIERGIWALASVVRALPSSMQPDVWLEAWERALRYGSVRAILYPLVYGLLSIYDQMTQEHRMRIEESDWNAEVWNAKEWKRKLTDGSFDSNFAQGFSLLLKHSSFEFKRKTWWMLKDGLDHSFSAFALIPLLPIIPTERQEVVSAMVIRETGFDRSMDIISTLISRWPEEFLWHKWQYLLKVVDENSQSQRWFTKVTAHLSPSYTFQAWQLLLDKCKRDYPCIDEEVFLLLVKRLPQSQLKQAYQILEQFKASSSFYVEDAIEVAIARRLSNEELRELFEKPVVPFPADIFTCSLDKYSQFGGPFYSSNRRVSSWSELIQSEFDFSAQEDIKMNSQVSWFVAYPLIGLGQITSWIWKPFSWIKKHMGFHVKHLEDQFDTRRDLRWYRRALLATVWASQHVYDSVRRRLMRTIWDVGRRIERSVPSMGSSQTRAYFTVKRTVLLFVLCLHLGSRYAITRREAKTILHDELTSSQGLSRLQQLVALRPVLQRAGGKELRHQVQIAYQHACTWWQTAVRESQD